MTRKFIVPMLVLAVAITGFAGCKKKAPETVPVAPPPSTQKAEPAEPTTPPKTDVTETFRPPQVETAPVTDPSVDELNQRIKPLQTVFFEYDSSDLDDTSRAVLQSNADWLKKNPKRSIRIEGHCDERGTIKYNLALGERRANSVREYLEGLGVATGRMRIVTYGEERPVDAGHDDGAWRKNRRGEFWFES